MCVCVCVCVWPGGSPSQQEASPPAGGPRARAEALHTLDTKSWGPLECFCESETAGGSPGYTCVEAEDGRASPRDFWGLELCCGLVGTWLSMFPFSKEGKVSMTVMEGLGEGTRAADPALVACLGAEEGQGVLRPADHAGTQAAGGRASPGGAP